jgi:hypothetical protein
MTRRVLPMLLGLTILWPSAVAQAADTHAPSGARGDWLPASEWVMSSWLPYDEQRLYDLLQTDRAELDTWLDDRRTLAALAARRGHRSPRALAAALVAPRTRHASRRLARTLRARALDTLTQAHLANHVLFHVFHTPAIAEHASRIFGVTPARYRRLRDAGNSPQSIGATAGRSPEHVAAALRDLLLRRGARAVATGATSRRQAAALLAHQDAGLGRYVQRHYRTTAQQVQFVCHL